MAESLDELRVAVAVEIFGWRAVDWYPPSPIDGWKRLAGIPPYRADQYVTRLTEMQYGGEEVPDFPRDWTALGSLLERMRELGWVYELSSGMAGTFAMFRNYTGARGTATAPTLPEAAARAALEAVRAENGVAR